MPVSCCIRFDRIVNRYSFYSICGHAFILFTCIPAVPIPRNSCSRREMDARFSWTLAHRPASTHLPPHLHGEIRRLKICEADCAYSTSTTLNHDTFAHRTFRLVSIATPTTFICTDSDTTARSELQSLSNRNHVSRICLVLSSSHLRQGRP